MITSTCPNCLFTTFSGDFKERESDGVTHVILRFKCGECGCEFEDIMVVDQTNILKEGILPRLNIREVLAKFGPHTAKLYQDSFGDFANLSVPVEHAKYAISNGEHSNALRMLAGWLNDNKKEMAKDFIRQLYQDFYA